MNKGSNKIYQWINPLLALIAVFTVVLTLYSCSKFFVYLPSSDTWVYTDFLAQAAQGRLDIHALFEKHNNVHLIALPKLVYFFDMWLTNGAGALTTLVSLIAMIASTLIFINVICHVNNIDKIEKRHLGLLSVIILLSTSQVESLLNPANLQWSLLTFTATLTAWFVYQAALHRTAVNIAGIALGALLTALTSASILLIIIPLIMLTLSKKFIIRAASIVTIGSLAILLISELFFTKTFALIAPLFINWLKFTVDFLVPPVERLHSIIATSLAGLLVFFGLFRLSKEKYNPEQKEIIFFLVLLWFSLFVIFVTGVVRSYTPTAFTFRFVNIGFLFAAATIPLLFILLREQKKYHISLISISVVYALLACYINMVEAGNFGYGRNHLRLTQVAHALDINDPFVISAMPGTIWEKIDFDTVQANKRKLQNVGAGVYGSVEFKHVGQSIKSLESRSSVSCKTNIIKMRRLLPEQAAYRLLGETSPDQGDTLSAVYFVDSENTVRGYAIPMEPSKNIFKNLVTNKQWAGFVNLDKSTTQNKITIYAFNDKQICEGEKIELPEYLPPEPRKKEKAAATE